jgi:4,5-DOPA dioxygenase extradiol
MPSASPYIRSSYFAVFFVSLFIPLIYRISQSYRSNTMTASSQTNTSELSMANNGKSKRMPIYFLGIGGPSSLENTGHPAYAQLVAVGQEITTKVKPKAVVVFSAHWQDSPTKIAINVAEQTDIIYDFHGFPQRYYEYKYPHRGSSEVAEEVIGKLTGAGIEVERVKRGLDHGAWSGFIIGV